MPWKKTACVLCGNGCGLEVQVEDNRIVKVHGDKDSPFSEGYICRKGMNVAFHQHNKDRVLFPLKKVGSGFERISWDQAISEISEKLKEILGHYGPRTLASLVGGGEFAFVVVEPAHGISIPSRAGPSARPRRSPGFSP